MKPEEPMNPRAILGLLGSLHETIERLKVGEGLEYQPPDDMDKIKDAVIEWIKRVGGLTSDDAKLGVAGIVEMVLKHHAIIKEDVERFGSEKVGCFGVPGAVVNKLSAMRDQIADARKPPTTSSPVAPYPIAELEQALIAWYQEVGHTKFPLPAHEQIAAILTDHSQAVQILREERNRVHFTDVHVEIKRMVAEAEEYRRTIDAAGVVAKRLQEERDRLVKEHNAKQADRDALANEMAAINKSIRKIEQQVGADFSNTKRPTSQWVEEIFSWYMTARNGVNTLAAQVTDLKRERDMARKSAEDMGVALDTLAKARHEEADPKPADPVAQNWGLELERIHDLLHNLDGKGWPVSGSAFEKVAWLKNEVARLVEENQKLIADNRDYAIDAARINAELASINTLCEAKLVENVELKSLVESRKKEHEEFRAKALADRAGLIEENARLRGEHTIAVIKLSKEISKLKQGRSMSDPHRIANIGLVDTIERLERDNGEYAVGVEKMKAELSAAQNTIEELRQKNGSLHESVTLLTPDRERVLELAERYGKYKQHRGPLVISDFVNHLVDNLIDAKARIARLSPNEPNP